MAALSQRYYGWNIVAAACLITLLTVGMRMGIGPFFIPIVQDLGISRGELGAIVAVGMLAYGFVMPLAGHLASSRGTAFTLLLGVALVTIAVIWTVLASRIVGFALAFGILLSVGLALTSQVTLTPVVSRWFIHERGKALFFLSTGAMAGIAIMTPVLSLAVNQLGWRGELIAFNALLIVLIVPSALFVIRDQPPDNAVARTSEAVDGAAAGTCRLAPLAELGSGAAMRTSHFAYIVAGLFACGYSMNLLGTQGVPMLRDHGFSAPVASLGIGVIGLVAVAGTVVLGRLSDHVPRRNMLALIYVIRGLGFIGLVAAAQAWQVFAVAAVAGLVWAGSVALSSAILADIFGPRHVGVLVGWAYVGHQIGAAISSWLGGWGYEQFGSHWVSFGSAGIVLLLAGVISCRLPARMANVTRHTTPAVS